ncbi:MAG: TetR/AcrR family transcriptional regulator [Peptococcaceae bacterium]
MVRGFTDGKRREIRIRLLNKGRELFAARGFKNTGVRELAEAAGIAPGTFYQFFPAKEDLFFEIMEAEGNQMRRKLLAVVGLHEDDPYQAIQGLFYQFFAELNHSVLLKSLIMKGEMDDIYRRFTPRQKKAHNEASIIALEPIVKKWTEKGLIKLIDPQLLVGALRSLIFAELFKEQMGLYPPAPGFLLEQFLRGVVPGREDKKDD